MENLCIARVGLEMLTLGEACIPAAVVLAEVDTLLSLPLALLAVDIRYPQTDLVQTS